MFDEFLKHFMLASFRFKFIAVKKNSKFQNEVKNIILFLRNFLLKNSRSSEKMSKAKKFLKLAKECEIIFWKRFEQFLDFAKIYHLQKIKKILESS